VDAVRAGLQERYRFAVDLGLGLGLRQGEAFSLDERDNPEPPTNELEERQRKPITVHLVLSTSQGNKIYYRTWNEVSWRPALAAAGVIKVVGEKIEVYRARTRKKPVYERSRSDMFHVLRHTFASVQLEAGESIVSLSEWLGHASPNITLDHYAHFMP
jgi:integrase